MQQSKKSLHSSSTVNMVHIVDTRPAPNEGVRVQQFFEAIGPSRKVCGRCTLSSFYLDHERIGSAAYLLQVAENVNSLF